MGLSNSNIILIGGIKDGKKLRHGLGGVEKVVNKKTDAQARANQKWKTNNKDRQYHYVKKYHTKKYIEIADQKELDEIKELVRKREDELNV